MCILHLSLHTQQWQIVVVQWYLTVIIGSIFVTPPLLFNKKAYFFYHQSDHSSTCPIKNDKLNFLLINTFYLQNKKSMQVDCFITPQINEKSWHTQNMDFLERQPKQMIDKVWLMFWSLINSPGICSHTEYYPSPTRCPSCIVKQLIAQTEPVPCEVKATGRSKLTLEYKYKRLDMVIKQIC